MPVDNDRKAEKARVRQIKKELDTAKGRLKSRKDLEKSETSLRNILKDSASMNDIRVHSMLYDVVKLSYLAGNEKLFLKEKYDTAQLFSIAHRMFLVANKLDSVDAIPNKKGVVRMSYRRPHAQFLQQYVNNLYSGVVYFVNKRKWEDAASLAGTYLSLPDWPLFSDTKLPFDSLKHAHSSYLALLSNYRLKKYDKAKEYEEVALKYTPRYELCLICLASMAEQQKDTTAYLNYLTKGLESFPKSRYFATHLLEYYSSKQLINSVLNVTDKVLDADSLNAISLMARQTIALSRGQYDECIKQGMKMLSYRDSIFNGRDSVLIADVNYNIGVAYYNQAVELSEATTKLKSRNKKAKEIYKLCMPYMETYRKLRPEAIEKWKPILYNVYLNLNLGKQFTEIENL